MSPILSNPKLVEKHTEIHHYEPVVQPPEPEIIPAPERVNWDRIARWLIVILLLLIFLQGHGWAQLGGGTGPQPNTYTIYGQGNPVGSCSAYFYYIDTTNKNFWGCVNGTYVQFNGGGGGSFTALTGDAQSTSTGGATTVLGLNNTLLSSLATGILKNTTGTGVPSIAVAGTDYQAPLSLLAGTYTNGDWCSYASSGTLLNCNNAVPQAALSLVKGTYADGDLCTYAASGTLLNCNTATSTFAPAAGSSSITTLGTIATGVWQATPIGASYVATLNQNTTGTAANLSGTPALPNGTTATTQSACDNSTKIATTGYLGTTCTTVETSGSPLSVTAQNQQILVNTSGAYVVDLPSPTTSGPTICLKEYHTRAVVMSFVPAAGVTIYYKGVAGTPGSSTGLVSGGVAGDSICVSGVDTTTYEAWGPGATSTWTNN